jgi:hypothetical protein
MTLVMDYHTKKSLAPARIFKTATANKTKQNRKTNACSSRTPKLKQMVNPRNQK